MSTLRELAKAVGLEPDYKSWRGEPVSASDESVRQALHAIVGELGVDPSRSDAVAELERVRWAEIVPPVVLAWDGIVSLPFSVRADFDADWEATVTTEDGQTFSSRGRLFALPADSHAHPGGVVHCIRHTTLSLGGALGYHTLYWKVGAASGEAMVIAAPTRGYGPPGDGFRRWGVFAPVYGLAAADTGQTGDLGTLARLMDAVDRRGGSYVATLPLLAAFLDEPYASSPYSPASRLFWNELYLDLHKICPEVGLAVPAAPPIISGAPIDYRAHYKLRRPLIDELARRLMDDVTFPSGIAQWAREKLVYDYAAFRALGEQYRTGWQSWPAAHRDGTRPASTRDDAIAMGADPARVDTHVVAQWLMQCQLEQLQGGQVSLYLDLPVGVNGDAYEVWRSRNQFLVELSAGAPPDALFLGGQNWGLPPLSPVALRRDHYRYFIRSLRHHMKVAGMLRIDHVMGLFRLYCVPRGRPATDGVYLKYPHEELLAILTLESRRSFCTIAGEDLGTVPDHVRPAMTKHGMFRLHVGQWAFPSRAGDAPTPSPAEAVASLNTHDTATFAGWWRGADIANVRDLGLITDAQEHRERQTREEQKAAILAFEAKGPAAAPTSPLTEVERAMVAVTADLARGPAEIVLVSLDDLVLDPVPHNVPGTVDERPNWQRRVQAWSTSLDPEKATPAARAALDALVVARPRR